MDGYFIVILSNPDAQVLRTRLTRDPGLHPGTHACEPATEHLLYFELCNDAETACRRERQLRHWNRARRAHLISTMNPLWRDLRSLW